jgi:hypothetical protein
MQPQLSKEMLAFNLVSLLLQAKLNDHMIISWSESGLTKLLKTSVEILQSMLDPNQITVPTVITNPGQKTLVYGA